jgi:hypothetical protein
MAITLNGTTGIDTPSIVADTNTLYVDAANNNVGIGTSSPTEKLDVSGNLRLGASAYLKIGTGFSSYIQGTTNTLTFGTNASDRMTLDSSGNLLVGTTSTATTSVGIVAIATTPYLGVKTEVLSAGYFYNKTNGGSGTVFQIRSNNIDVGQISQNGTNTSFTTTSDHRLKDNITPMTGALNVVQQLKPVTYNWKADGSAGQGFIAHELQAVVPDCVTGEKDAVDAEGKPVYQGIDTSFLVATLTAAIQELKATVDAQAARIAALESAGVQP